MSWQRKIELFWSNHTAAVGFEIGRRENRDTKIRDSSRGGMTEREMRADRVEIDFKPNDFCTAN
jgi:hypothetical protein